MHLTQPVHKGRYERPGALALVFRDRRRTFAELADRVARLAGALRGLGVAPGDRVGILAQNSDRYVEALFAVWWAGGAVNPVNTRWSADEVAYSLDDCDTRVLLVDDAFAPVAGALKERSRALRTLVHMGDGPTPDGMPGFEALIEAAEPVPDAMRGGDDLAAILYTGGTTGLPKGVMLTHGNLYANALSTIAATPRPERSVGLQVAPLFHVGGIGPVMQYALRLATQVILPGFTPPAVLQAVAAEGVTEVFLVPTMLKQVIEHPEFANHDTSSLRLVLYGAAPIDGTLLDRAIAAFPGAGFAQVYGMTELAPVVTVLGEWWHTADGRAAGKLASAGRPVSLADVRVVDIDGQELPPGRAGEIVARGANVMAGYWNKPEETAAALRGGWMHTGDVGFMDGDGFLFVVDRIKDMIVSGGENVYSAEVENVILEVPAVSSCAVIGVPDETWGERVHAVIVARDGMAVDAEAVIAHCKARIAGYKCPRSVEFRTEMPLSPAGKLLKFKLREPYWEGRSRRVS
ncbi:long-chain fatty acid--CoA ligase [Azospirillum sp.]|uniref:acyl-CoA synthetase n=1 Tax=Azospirillum sp. TaxID=34012 RepID=UPI002D742C66|nr:long-chain fatty acid--CoA ligase [Azospirillum sp.]HYD66848.1 long-chain fatty acid--CoA ligase [Azospirillum sp.]